MRALIALATLGALAGPAAHAPARQSATPAVVTVDHRAPAIADETLTALRGRYVSAVNAADASALAGLYAPDALVVVADGIVLRGETEIVRYFQDAFAGRADGARVTLRPERFAVENGVASETGGFSESQIAEAESVTGVYVTIYTRTAAGEWRIAMEVRTRGRDKQIVRW